ncbi:Copia protein [Dufourea novaeangliae]|uniref:Copia protein n=1 Tax=Dufourea novaeangliae TaxID=178035 RepID=A0A154P0B4_DUFNO|nr:Copia protein [Dufourea novaeangliae]
MNRNVYKFVREKGIQINACPPYVRELNGTVERFNPTIMDMSRCLLDEARVHRRFWPEVVCASAYLKNRVLANTVEKKTPYEIFFDKKPSVKHLRLYGSRVFVRVPEQKRESKWDKKARLGILLGYTEVGYRVLLDNKIIVARHVEVVEEIGFKEDAECDEFNAKDVNPESNSEKSSDSEYQDTQNSTEEPEQDERIRELKRSDRIRKPPARFNEDFIYNNVIYVNHCSADSPDNFEDAVNNTESEFWKEAMDREIECLDKNSCNWLIGLRIKR